MTLSQLLTLLNIYIESCKDLEMDTSLEDFLEYVSLAKETF